MNTTPRRVAVVVWMLLPLLVMATATRGAEPASPRIVSDHWYSVLLQGRPAGWLRSTQSREDGRIISAESMRLSLGRENMVIQIEMDSRFVESEDGKPIESQSTQKLGAMEMRSSMRFTDGGIEVTASQMGRPITTQAPLPEGEWLTPARVEALLAREVAAGSKAIEFRSMEASGGPVVVRTQMTLIGSEHVEVMGKVVPATVWRTTLTPPGSTGRMYLNAAGRPVRMSLPVMPGMELTLVQADRQLAEAKVNPPELLVQTFVKPRGVIASPRDTRQGVYELTLAPDADQPKAELPRGGVQRVIWADETTARVVVDLDQPVNPGDDLPGDAERQPSVMVNSEDEKVKELTAQALATLNAGATSADKARALRTFVGTYIQTKDLSVGLATASETARTAQGDCTEHAVLLAAMLRCAGIPSRTVSGLLYVDEFLGHRQIFGYHMWTQAWLAGEVAGGGGGKGGGGGSRWVDLDATLPGRTFDAAHIALSTSAMADTAGINDMVRMAPMMGRLSIQVVTTKP